MGYANLPFFYPEVAITNLRNGPPFFPEDRVGSFSPFKMQSPYYGVHKKMLMVVMITSDNIYWCDAMR